MDEISQLQSICEQKVELLRKLREDCERLESKPSFIEGASSNKQSGKVKRQHLIGEGMTERIDWALQNIEGNHNKLPSKLDDLKSSLDVVSHTLSGEIVIKAS